MRCRSSHMKMSPLHLEHLLGFRLLCLVMGVSYSTARTRRHQPNHRPSCTSCTLAVLAQPSTTCNQLASPGSQHTVAWASQPEGLQGCVALNCAWRGAPGVPTWVLWPFPTTAVGACSSTAKLQRCMAALHAGTHAQLCTCAMQKAPVHGQSLLPQSEPYTSVHISLGLLLHWPLHGGGERAGEISWVAGMYSQSFPLLPIHQFTCKTN